MQLLYPLGPGKFVTPARQSTKGYERAVRSKRRQSRHTRAARRSASLAAKAASLRAFSSWPRTSHRGRSASATQRACPACCPFGQYTSGLLARACSCPCS